MKIKGKIVEADVDISNVAISLENNIFCLEGLDSSSNAVISSQPLPKEVEKFIKDWISKNEKKLTFV